MYGIEPDMTREGGSIPVTLTFQEATGKSVLLLPIGAADDGAHSTNEKINRKVRSSLMYPSCSNLPFSPKNYIDGSKVFAAYLYFISAL